MVCQFSASIELVDYQTFTFKFICAWQTKKEVKDNRKGSFKEKKKKENNNEVLLNSRLRQQMTWGLSSSNRQGKSEGSNPNTKAKRKRKEDMKRRNWRGNLLTLHDPSGVSMENSSLCRAGKSTSGADSLKRFRIWMWWLLSVLSTVACITKRARISWSSVWLLPISIFKAAKIFSCSFCMSCTSFTPGRSAHLKKNMHTSKS